VRSSNPVLVPLTRKSRKATPCERVEVDAFPFRIGREARLGATPWKTKRGERRQGVALPNNDLYLEKVGRAQFISREHAQIEERGDGTFYVVDRGSICGTTVGTTFVGGISIGGECALKDGDVVTLGPARSPYRYRFDAQGAVSDGPHYSRRRRSCISSAWLGVAAILVAMFTIVFHGFML
jgi:hypothetical protein